MSDRTQDLKNLRAVATACKNYVDETKEQILWQVGQYNITTQDDNTSASTKTVPANATRCKIKRIYGLTQKLNPTTASDSTSYSVKTMPATVYDFDISKVEGNSEKSENLIVLNDVTETTTSEITYSIKNGVLKLNGTATNYGQLLNITLDNVDGYFKMFIDGTATGSSGYSVTHSGGTSYNANGYYTGITSIKYWFNNGDTFTNRTYKPMLVSGSTAPTTYKQGYTGIHNFEWNGLVVKNSDDEVMQNISIDLSSILYNGSPLFEGNSLKAVGTAKDYITPYKAVKNVEQLLGSTYENAITIATTSAGLKCVVIQTNITFVDSDTQNIAIINNLGLTAMPASSQWTTTAINVIAFNRSKRILINFNQTLTDEEMIAKAKTLILNFAILTPIEVSINWASLLRGITGYSNGTISLLNTNNQDTANLITYNSIIKENCCAKMVQSRGGNVIKTVSFSTQASDGWSAGSMYNYRDYTTNKRETGVNKNSDLGGFDYTIQGTGQNVRFRTTINDIAGQVSLSTPIITLSRIYTASVYNDTRADMTIYYDQNPIGTKSVGIKNDSYNDTTTFKTAMTNEPLYYELADASKTSTDITPIENVLEVQPGDELAFYDANDNLVTIPSDLTYRIEVAR